MKYFSLVELIDKVLAYNLIRAVTHEAKASYHIVSRTSDNGYDEEYGSFQEK